MNRTSVWIGIALGTLTLVVVSFFMVVIAISPTYACTSPYATMSASSGSATSSAAPALAPIGSWNIQQVTNAATIVAVGKARGIPARGWVVALATAMQESTLRNLANSRVPVSLTLPHQGVGSDHDSVGLFQQRPLPPDGAGSWGTVRELMTPSISASKFYSAMLRVPNWETRSVTDVAQTVQRSAFPDAYAKWEPQAAMLAARLAGVSSIYDLPGASLAVCDQAVVVSTGGWVRPVNAKVVSGFGPRGGDYHYGTDLGASRNTAIRAASGGKVVYAGCDPGTGNCDVDGATYVSGCGWYVEILHADNVATRYCHMVRKPEVTVGQTVAAGHIIGLVGTSGNSSGPHLHFEIHDKVSCNENRCMLNNANAVNPETFMRDKGAALVT